MTTPRFLALLVGVMVCGLAIGWFVEATTSTAALERMVSGQSRPDRTGPPAPYDFAIDTTKGSATAPTLADAEAYPAPRYNGPCSLPYAGAGDEVVLLDISEGEAVSSVAVADVNLETRAADVEVQAGDRPLYLVLASERPIVWRFSGAAGRVGHLVLMTNETAPDGGAAAGAVGVSADKITTAPLRNCFTEFSEPGSPQALAAASRVALMTGRQPDVVGAAHDIAAVQLPSGMAAKLEEGDAPTPAGLDAGAWSHARRFTPAGVMQLAAADVHGSEPAIAYDILPARAGIAQLLASGSLVETQDGYRITKPIAHFPAELFGAEATTFSLAAGVPMPAGSLGHSCVIDEATGRAITQCP
ncbi:MAG TPA: hypothetical protein VGI95_15385 [Caulobacteraceae bacterium]